MLDRRTHSRQLRAATPPAVPVREPSVMTQADQIRSVKAVVAKCVEFKERVTIAEVARRVLDETGLAFGGPTLAKYIKTHGFVRMRQGIYSRAGGGA